MHTGSWSIDEWCSTQNPSSWDDDVFASSKSTVEFVKRLNLTFIHPFCNPNTAPKPYPIPGIPEQGPLLNYDHIDTWYDVVTTVLAKSTPALAAMMELWLRLFSFFMAPICIIYLIYIELSTAAVSNTTKDVTKVTQFRRKFLPFVCLIVSTSSVILITDTLYILEYGPMYGGTIFGLSIILSWNACKKYSLNKARRGIVGIVLLFAILLYDKETGSIQFGERKDIPVSIEEGLYYSKSSQIAEQIVLAWPEHHRTYTSTPWLPTGDGRTGIPFLINKVPLPNYTRVWLPLADGEYLALDIAFPTKIGYNSNQPLYLVLHGLNGGSSEEYVKDFTLRRTEQDGATVVIMVARGLMDLPIRGMNLFHGARWEDPYLAAIAIKKAIEPSQMLAGVGYSMGAIILSNMVARTGAACPLDVGVAISGGLDMRNELDLPRAQRLWQPLLIEQLRDHFALGKWGERVRHRLSKKEMRELMRATYVTDFDRTAVVAYHGFRDLVHYYSEMSALGDVPFPSDEYLAQSLPSTRRIHNVSIPFCVVHALDDPLVTWRTVASDNGLLHPSNLTELTGNGNLFLLLTKRGGHVGWPTGWFPHINKWTWMSDISMSFVEAVRSTKKQRNEDD